MIANRETSYEYNTTNRVLIPKCIINYGSAVYTTAERYVHVAGGIQIINYININKLDGTQISQILDRYKSAKLALKKAIENVDLLKNTYLEAAKNIKGFGKMNTIKREFTKIYEELSNNNINNLLNRILQIEGNIENINRQVNLYGDGSKIYVEPEDWYNILKGKFY